MIISNYEIIINIHMNKINCIDNIVIINNPFRLYCYDY